jgi:RNA polymerase sigma-70 factor (ECF subfamily)
MESSYRQAHTLAYRLTGNSADAEDLVQETFIRAYRFFHRYNDALPFTSWLYRIMTNLHIDQVRKKSRIKVTSIDHAGADKTSQWDIADLTSTPERNMMDSSLNEPVQTALKSMSPDFRAAVVLADVEGMAYEEIAETMQVSIGTVRSRIHRGRKQLRKHLQAACPHLVRENDHEL